MKNKTCSFVRATLSALCFVAAFALKTTAIAQAPPGSLWYNGDFNYVNTLPNERNTVITHAAVYDDFITPPASRDSLLVFFPTISPVPTSPGRFGKSAPGSLQGTGEAQSSPATRRARPW